MKKILIVEDEIIIALDIASKLRSLGYEVTDTAVGPEDALVSVMQNTPDLIFMDINLKADIDGIRLAHIIRRDRDIPVIYLTSYSDESMIERAMQTEPYGYIIKPYTLGTITAVLRTAFTRQELEKRTSSQNEMLKTIIDSITNAVAIIFPDGVIESTNQRFSSIFPHSDIAGRNITEFFGGSINCGTIMKLHDTGAQEIIKVTANGADRHLLLSASSYTWTDGFRILLNFTDLTEMYAIKSALSDAEVRFSKLFHKKLVPAVLASVPEMKIFEMNEAFTELYGITQEEAAAGSIESLIGEEAAGLLALMIHEDTGRTGVVRQRAKDGGEFYADIRWKTVTFDGKNFMLIDMYDVTEQVRLSEMERELQQKLIHANKMTSLGTLVSGVAHEINNPNNFIMFNSSLLVDFWNNIYEILEGTCGIKEIDGIPLNEFRADTEKLMQGIIKGSERIKNIVQDLKGFAKTEHGDAFERLSMDSIIRTAVRILEHQINKSTENFILDIEESMPDISGNPQKLEQLIINIIMNALEALTSVSAMVEVKCSLQDGNVVVEVTDEGVGIPQENLDRITEPFFTTKQSKGGTGLGLSIAYAIIKEHGGVLDIKSYPFSGTKVRITLPEFKDAE